MRVFCFFEQSGTFRDAFRKLGYEAVDYDIENRFGKTDVEIDLFKEIESAYDGNPSIFDNVSQQDLIIAFFPCIRFSKNIQLLFRGDNNSQKNGV